MGRQVLHRRSIPRKGVLVTQGAKPLRQLERWDELHLFSSKGSERLVESRRDEPEKIGDFETVLAEK